MRDGRDTIYADKVRFSNHVELIICHKTVKGQAVAGPLEFTEIEEHLCSTPTLTLAAMEAQMLMDDLWNCGIRPSEGTGSAGSLRATEKHLGDMRTIAFKRLNIEKEKT